jgi:hypothetical protein
LKSLHTAKNIVGRNQRSIRTRVKYGKYVRINGLGIKTTMINVHVKSCNVKKEKAWAGVWLKWYSTCLASARP